MRFLSLRLISAAGPVGGFGVYTSLYGTIEVVVWATLLLTIWLQIHKSWYLYTPLIEKTCDHGTAHAATLQAYTVSMGVAASVVLTYFHMHLLSELMVVIVQILIVFVLLKLAIRSEVLRIQIRDILLHELVYAGLLVWVIFLTARLATGKSGGGEIALAVAVCFVSAYYVISLVTHQPVKMQALSDELDSG